MNKFYSGTTDRINKGWDYLLLGRCDQWQKSEEKKKKNLMKILGKVKVPG